MPINDEKSFSFSNLLDDFNDGNAKFNEKLYIIAKFVQDKIANKLGADLHINYHSLYSALERYSKDVYGLNRIKIILSKYITSTDDLDNAVNEIKGQSGLMIESLCPHINKKLAYLTYHLVFQKPFSASKINSSFFKNRKTYQNFGKYFNEIIVFLIIGAILKEYKSELDIIDTEYFLHSLGCRKISRASLEIIFQSVLLYNE